MHWLLPPTLRETFDIVKAAVRCCAAATLICWSLNGGTVTSSHEGHAHHEDQETTVAGDREILAPGYQALDFEPPKPNSYTLPPLGDASDGEIIDAQGRTTGLHDLFEDRAVVLAFIYTRCGDVNGCPLATFVFQQTARRLATEPALSDKVRLLSLSFDPDHDTPTVLADYAESFAVPRVDWRFITPAGHTALRQLLRGYGQSVVRDASGTPRSHILRVYLIDQKKRIRNLYSTSFLHAETVINDLKTILNDNPSRPAVKKAIPGVAVIKPADDRTGYDSAAYATSSRAYAHRQTRGHDLVALASEAALGLPRAKLQRKLAFSSAQIALGRQLFFDRRLSHNNTLSCGMCHIPAQGFTTQELQTPIGFEGRTVRRNAPTLLNVGFAKTLFHDGRETHLAQQVWSPLLATNEMANPSIGHLLTKLSTTGDYGAAFNTAFPERGLTMETLGVALAAYQNMLIAASSPFDRYYYAKDNTALTATEQRGLALFTGKAGCVNCHLIGEEFALFTDHGFHNTGVGYARSMARTPARREVLLAPGTAIEIDTTAIAASSAPVPNDLGRYEVTLDPDDRWRYKTPSLRNLTHTAPYMHDGSLPDLHAVVAFYNRGGVPNELLDPLIKPLGLNTDESDALVAFMRSLTSPHIEALIEDANAAPIGDPDETQRH